MNNQDFTTALLVDQTAKQVFEAINNVTDWWTENLEGASHSIGDEFSVQFWDLHYSKQKLVEVVPDKKVVWLVTDSKLTFVENQAEWTGTKIVFEIDQQGDQTKLSFTHQGLVPAFECFKDCFKGWTFYINDSLNKLITTGKGEPTKKEN